MSRKNKKDPMLYSEELDWLLTCRDAACGYRSTLGGQIATIERGGVFGEASSDRYNDEQCDVGLGATGAFARDRKMNRRWQLMTRWAQGILIAYYIASCPEEASTVYEDGIVWEPRRKFSVGFEGQFAQYSGVVLYLTDAKELEKLKKRAVKATEKKFENRPDGKVEAAIKRAIMAVRKAHLEYYQVCIDEEFEEPATWGADAVEEVISQSEVPPPAHLDDDGVWRQPCFRSVA